MHMTILLIITSFNSASSFVSVGGVVNHHSTREVKDAPS